MNFTFTINGEQRTVDGIPGQLPMLWVLRDKLGINGPKYGCGVGVCKACTSHLDGEEFQPCVTPASECEGREVTTIEGLADGDTLHPVQQAWLEMDVPQCGFCQPGQIMTAAALIARNGGDVSDADIDAIDNTCRCGTYARIRQAIKRAAGQSVAMTPNQPGGDRIQPQDGIPEPTGLPAPLDTLSPGEEDLLPGDLDPGESEPDGGDADGGNDDGNDAGPLDGIRDSLGLG